MTVEELRSGDLSPSARPDVLDPPSRQIYDGAKHVNRRATAQLRELFPERDDRFRESSPPRLFALSKDPPHADDERRRQKRATDISPTWQAPTREHGMREKVGPESRSGGVNETDRPAVLYTHRAILQPTSWTLGEGARALRRCPGENCSVRIRMRRWPSMAAGDVDPRRPAPAAAALLDPNVAGGRQLLQER